MDKLNFGTAGIPFSTKEKNTINGIKQVSELKLEAMELEFVRSINISKEKAPEVNEAAKKNNVALTCHAPYFINLNSKEKPKWHASINRIVQSAETANLCGAYSVCFHPGFYMKEEPRSVFENIKNSLREIFKKISSENKIWVRPETTGKPTQFGNIHEILELSREFERLMPCIDFSHLHARSNGKYNTKEEFREILALVENKLGRKGLDNMHIHLSGINYGEKGEKNHLNLKDSDMKYKELVEAWKEFKIKGIVISESPNIEGDALLLKRLYNDS